MIRHDIDPRQRRRVGAAVVLIELASPPERDGARDKTGRNRIRACRPDAVRLPGCVIRRHFGNAEAFVHRIPVSRMQRLRIQRQIVVSRNDAFLAIDRDQSVKISNTGFAGGRRHLVNQCLRRRIKKSFEPHCATARIISSPLVSQKLIVAHEPASGRLVFHHVNTHVGRRSDLHFDNEFHARDKAAGQLAPRHAANSAT